MTRKECLTAAIDVVCKDRENTYGSPEDNFKLIILEFDDFDWE